MSILATEQRVCIAALQVVKIVTIRSQYSKRAGEVGADLRRVALHDARHKKVDAAEHVDIRMWQVDGFFGFR